MKTKTKSSLIIISTLLIGIVLGFLLKSWITENRFDKFKSRRGPEGLVKMLNEVIQPDEHQKAEIEPVLRKFQIRFQEVMTMSRKEMAVTIDSLRSELKPLLNEEQLERFNEKMKFGRRSQSKSKN